MVKEGKYQTQTIAQGMDQRIEDKDKELVTVLTRLGNVGGGEQQQIRTKKQQQQQQQQVQQNQKAVYKPKSLCARFSNIVRSER